MHRGRSPSACCPRFFVCGKQWCTPPNLVPYSTAVVYPLILRTPLLIAGAVEDARLPLETLSSAP